MPQFSYDMVDENKILLDGVGLQLYIFYLREPNNLNSRRKGLIRVFNIAKEVLTKLGDLNSTSNLIRYGPASYFQLAVLAAIVILKLNHSSCFKYIDTESGKRAFDLGILLLRQASLQDNDLPGRTSEILVQLWSAQEQQGRRDEEPSLKLRTRSGASLLHDSLWAWREKFGGQGSGTQTPSGGMCLFWFVRFKLWHSKTQNALTGASSTRSCRASIWHSPSHSCR
jgi:transcriptional regulatory protein LEU3